MVTLRSILFIRQGNPSVFQNLEQILKSSPPDRGRKSEYAQRMVVKQCLVVTQIFYNLTIIINHQSSLFIYKKTYKIFERVQGKSFYQKVSPAFLIKN